MNELELVINEVKKAVVGKDEHIKKILACILARGHVLLEDIPGVGKTNLTLALSKALSLDFHRMQFTSDVLPGDVTGFIIYNQKTNDFECKEGSIMCNLFLADEINRTSPKTQSALLEVMEEGRTTVDGITYQLPQPFTVLATQNPYGSAGTQLLPDSQLDRFMVRLTMGYPSLEDEIEILKRKSQENPLDIIRSVCKPQDIIELQKQVDQVYVDDKIYDYIVRIIHKTRDHELIQQGASPRTSISLLKMVKAIAYMDHRNYVIPDDIKKVIYDVLSHRLILTYDAKVKGVVIQDVIKSILKEVKERIPNTPIVLHGASTVIPELVNMCNEFGGNIPGAKGVPDEILHEASISGVSKINVDTDLRLAMTAGIRKTFVENPNVFDPRKYLGEARELIKETVKHKIVDVFGSANKA